MTGLIPSSLQILNFGITVDDIILYNLRKLMTYWRYLIAIIRNVRNSPSKNIINNPISFFDILIIRQQNIEVLINRYNKSTSCQRLVDYLSNKSQGRKY